MRNLINILAFWILWTIVLFAGILCLFGVSLLDGFWPYVCTLGAVASAYCLILLMNDDKPVHYDR
jgi:polyferredoxin